MTTMINALRDILGNPDFYIESGSGYSGSWDYGAMIEYFFAGLLLCIAVSSIFKFIVKIFG